MQKVSPRKFAKIGLKTFPRFSSEKFKKHFRIDHGSPKSSRDFAKKNSFEKPREFSQKFLMS